MDFIKMAKYYKICLTCGKTVSKLNKDGMCKECLKREFKDLRYDDPVFAKQYGKKEVEAWLKDHGMKFN